jgi:hypothetical protein
LAGSIGLDLSRQLGNGNGGLPFTATFDSTGRQAGQHLGAVDTRLLEDWLRSVH